MWFRHLRNSSYTHMCCSPYRWRARNKQVCTLESQLWRKRPPFTLRPTVKSQPHLLGFPRTLQEIHKWQREGAIAKHPPTLQSLRYFCKAVQIIRHRSPYMQLFKTLSLQKSQAGMNLSSSLFCPKNMGYRVEKVKLKTNFTVFQGHCWTGEKSCTLVIRWDCG